MKWVNGKILNKDDKIVIITLLCIIIVSVICICLTSCNVQRPNEYPLDLSEIVETEFSNTVDGDSMYWAIYEDYNHDNQRSVLYMDKQTFDSLERAVYIFNKVDLECRDSINAHHGFIIVRDSEGLHLCSIR